MLYVHGIDNGQILISTDDRLDEARWLPDSLFAWGGDDGTVPIPTPEALKKYPWLKGEQ